MFAFTITISPDEQCFTVLSLIPNVVRNRLFVLFRVSKAPKKKYQSKYTPYQHLLELELRTKLRVDRTSNPCTDDQIPGQLDDRAR